jgi:hypothetical protein
MKQNDKGKKVGAAGILARKKASKDRAQAAAVDYVVPKWENQFKDSDVELAGYGNHNYDDEFKKYKQNVRDANTKANKGRISQSITGFTPREYTELNEDGSLSSRGFIEREIKDYQADNKGVSASRGRQIKEEARKHMYYGVPELQANRIATRYVNKEGNDSIVTAGKISRKGYDKAYQEALQATYDHSRPLNKAEKAETKKIKKAQQRGDLGRGSRASQYFYEENVRGK